MNQQNVKFKGFWANGGNYMAIKRLNNFSKYDFF